MASLGLLAEEASDRTGPRDVSTEPSRCPGRSGPCRPCSSNGSALGIAVWPICSRLSRRWNRGSGRGIPHGRGAGASYDRVLRVAESPVPPISSDDELDRVAPLEAKHLFPDHSDRYGPVRPV